MNKYLQTRYVFSNSKYSTFQLSFTDLLESNNCIFSGPYFPVFGLNTEVYKVFGHFSDSEDFQFWSNNMTFKKCICVFDWVFTDF